MPEDTFSSVHSTAAKDTQWLSFPEYANLVCGNTFKATDIAQGAIDVFLNLSTETVKTYPGLARVIVGALINALMQANGAHKERVLFPARRGQPVRNHADARNRPRRGPQVRRNAHDGVSVDRPARASLRPGRQVGLVRVG